MSEELSAAHGSFEELDPNTLPNGKLYDYEGSWRDRRLWLEEKGYVLRSRYQPGWIASWLLDNSKSWIYCEDGTMGDFGGITIDATRISDGARVLMKEVELSRRAKEIAIGQRFSANPMAADPRNHCIPIIETLTVPDDDNLVLIVMPLLTTYLEPKFKAVGELMEMFRQLFEGIQFMHHNNVAHCDCKDDNFMMDGHPLYSPARHSTNEGMSVNYSSRVQATTRSLQPVKYYAIDFGLSRQYAPGTPQEDTLLVPPYGGYKAVPEFLRNELCDPFRVDVYCVGNFVTEMFLEGRRRLRNIDFMQPLVSSMMHDDPQKRPTMDEVVREFERIRSRLSWWQLRAPVASDPLLLRPFRDVSHWSNQISLMRRGVPSIPMP